MTSEILCFRHHNHRVQCNVPIENYDQDLVAFYVEMYISFSDVE